MNHAKNYINTVIGKFKILDQKKQNNQIYLFCKCTKCNKERWIAQKHVKETKCCERKLNSSKFKPKIPKNKTINNIELLELTNQRKRTSVVWKCKCFCGNIFYATLHEIKIQKVKSCGCNKIKYSPQNLEKAIETYKTQNLKEGTSLARIQSNLIATNKSGVTGVFWSSSKQRWIARIEFKKEKHYLGSFKNKEDAIKARKEAEEKYFKPILNKYKK